MTAFVNIFLKRYSQCDRNVNKSHLFNPQFLITCTCVQAKVLYLWQLW